MRQGNKIISGQRCPGLYVIAHVFPNVVFPSSIVTTKRPEYLTSNQPPDKLGLIPGLTPNNQAINNT